MRALLALCFLAPSVAFAGAQRAFEVAKGADRWAFETAWVDADGAKHAVSFELPASAVRSDRAEGTGLDREALYKHAAAAVRAWGRTVEGVDVGARVEGGKVHIDVSGPPARARAALDEASHVRDEAIETWLTEHDYTRLRGGDLTFDHAKLVAEYSAEVAPIAAALAARAPDARSYAELALSFVQSIPYEATKKNGRDAGYRRPLAVLARNRGDCDSKAVLYLALVRAAHPDLDLAVVYVPGHALAGVGLPKERGDRAFRVDGDRFLYVEPVGPALHPLGRPAPENARAGKKGEVRVVPER